MVCSVAVAVATAASLLADVVWYRIGRTRGGRVLHLLCRISLEPDSCVRVTQNAFERWGARSLLIAKFVPALNTIAPPMAGITGMRLARFLLLDGLGALLYIGTFVLLGWIWSDQLEAVAESLAAVGGRVPLVVGSALLIWVLLKLVRRQLFLRELRIARITPEELKIRMDQGDQVVVVDLRHSSDVDASGVSIPGAIRIAVEEIDGCLSCFEGGRNAVYCGYTAAVHHEGKTRGRTREEKLERFPELVEAEDRALSALQHKWTGLDWSAFQ